MAGGRKTSAHGPEVELSIIEQREVDLVAHRGNIGLVKEELGGLQRKAPPKRGKAS
jgi:hypothetical protein